MIVTAMINLTTTTAVTTKTTTKHSDIAKQRQD